MLFFPLATMAAMANVCDVGGPADAGLVTLNGCNYGSVDAAIADAADGDTIYVCQGTWDMKEVEIARSITLLAVDGPDLTRLQGVELDLTVFGPKGVINVVDPLSTVFVEGFSIVGYDPYGTGVDLCAGCEAQLRNVKIFGNGEVGVWAREGATVTLVDSEVFANYNGGVRADGGGLVGLVGTVVWGNFGFEGAGLWLGDGSTVVGGVVESNWADDGGGVYTDGAAVLIATEIRANDAERSGGGIYVSGRTPDAGGALVELLDVSIHENTAFDGGGIFAEAWEDESRSISTLDLEQTSIRDNRADNDGGGVWSGARSLTAFEAEIAYNLANRGGGLFVHDLDDAGTTYQGGLQIFGNEAYGSGGGIALDASERLTSFHGLDVFENVAGATGGGIAALRPIGLLPTIDILGGALTGNAARQGGGLMLLGDDANLLTAFAMELRVEQNTAEEGGGLWVDDAVLYATGVQVLGNSGVGAGAQVTGKAGYLSSTAGDWDNSPEDVLTGAGNAYLYGSTDFSCDSATCTP